MPTKIIPVSAKLVFQILHAELTNVGNNDALALFYPLSVVRNALSTTNFQFLQKNLQTDEASLPSALQRTALASKFAGAGLTPKDVGIFILGNKSAKGNQGTYLDIAEKWLKAISNTDFLKLRSNSAQYNLELEKLISQKTLNEFETHCKNWYFGWRVGPSGDAQDIKFR